MKDDCRRLFRTQAAYDAAMQTYDDALAQLRRGCVRQYVATDYGHTSAQRLRRALCCGTA